MTGDSPPSATTLAAALPHLLLGIEDSLVRIGRGGVADQLRKVAVESWEYDDFADAAILHLLALPGAAVPKGFIPLGRGEIIALHDDVPVSVEIDSRGRLVGLEIQGAREILPLLEQIPAR